MTTSASAMALLAPPLLKRPAPTPFNILLCALRRYQITAGCIVSLFLAGWIVAMSSATAPSRHRTTVPPTTEAYCDPSVHHEFGYIKLPHKVNDHYFYSFFESRNDPANDPLVLWLEGGPGSSSTWTLFNMNGPCFIGDDLNSTVPNPHSWTNHANVIWLDQPTGVGFSYGDAQDDDQTEDDVGRNMFEFLRGWLKAHPSYASRPFFVTGQSYGGHYVPAVAHYIVTHQTSSPSNDAFWINLQGIAIGNGFTDAPIQGPMVVEMVESVQRQYNITLVSSGEMVELRQHARVVARLLEACQLSNETQACLDAMDLRDMHLVTPMVSNPSRNPYDVRELCSPNCTDVGMAKTGKYLNQPWIQARLGVHKTYEWSNDTVYDMFAVDIGKSAMHFIPRVLESGVRVLLYVGDADLMCDWKGNDAWTKAMKWPGQAAYNAAPVRDLVVNAKPVGQMQSAQNLTFVRVFEAGHGVPIDQPLVGLALIHRFFNHGAMDIATGTRPIETIEDPVVAG